MPELRTHMSIQTCTLMLRNGVMTLLKYTSNTTLGPRAFRKSPRDTRTLFINVESLRKRYDGNNYYYTKHRVFNGLAARLRDEIRSRKGELKKRGEKKKRKAMYIIRGVSSWCAYNNIIRVYTRNHARGCVVRILYRIYNIINVMYTYDPSISPSCSVDFVSVHTVYNIRTVRNSIKKNYIIIIRFLCLMRTPCI